MIGCDEAGRGSLAGPVVAAVCVLDPKSIGPNRTPDKWYSRVRDSKAIPEGEREILAKIIKGNAIAWGVGTVSEREIDEINIHNASLLAMRKAVENMFSKPGRNKISRSQNFVILVDGRFEIPDIECGQKCIIKGDTKSLSIAAASIIAKVHRDAIMKKLGRQFPKYGFERHKGYPTLEHRKAIQKLGITKVHRKSFLK